MRPVRTPPWREEQLGAGLGKSAAEIGTLRKLPTLARDKRLIGDRSMGDSGVGMILGHLSANLFYVWGIGIALLGIALCTAFAEEAICAAVNAPD
jgi:hypothetical protein